MFHSNDFQTVEEVQTQTFPILMYKNFD